MSKADKLLKRIDFYEKMASSQKPENDALLKKAELFERLALYSDRKSFLQAVAQAAPPGLDRNTRQLLQEAQQIMQNAGVDASAIGNLILFNKLEQWGAAVKSIRDALMLGKISPLSDEYKRLQTISTQIKSPEQSEAAGAMARPADVEFLPDSGDQIRARAPFPSIDKQDQQAVFNFAIQQGELVPDPAKQKADGSLGPETRKALEGVKNYFAKQNPQNPRMTDQQAIQAAKFKGR